MNDDNIFYIGNFIAESLLLSLVLLLVLMISIPCNDSYFIGFYVPSIVYLVIIFRALFTKKLPITDCWIKG